MPVLASDRVASAAGVSAPRPYSATVAVADWGAAIGGYYTLTVPASTHGKSQVSDVRMWEQSGADLLYVKPHDWTVLTNGDVEIAVMSVPDGRFDGRLDIDGF